jgi:antitoxin (DNA-binding transcriptional repressor) of toxin-antitoxin stability system
MAWIADGEQVAITMRRKVVARLVPEKATVPRKIEAPNFAAISKQIFGDRNIATDPVKAEREGYRW